MKNSTITAPVRIEVLLNGKRVAIAGAEGLGVISAVVTWVRRNPSKITAKMRADPEFDELEFLREMCEVELTSLDSVSDEHVSWAREALRPAGE